MANIRRLTRKRLGEILVAQGVITPEQVREVMAEQKKSGELTGEILVRWNYVSDYDIAAAVATQFSIPFMNCANYQIPHKMMDMLPLGLLQKHLVVPIDRFGDVIALVVAGPLEDSEVVEYIENRCGCTAQLYVSTVSDVKAALAKFADYQEKSQKLEPTAGPGHPEPKEA